MSEQPKQPPNKPPNDTPSYQKLYDKANIALANEPVDSPAYQQALEIKKSVEENHPELKVDSATSMTEPSIDKAVHDSAESNKDIGAKPSSQNGDGQSSTSSSTDDNQTDNNLAGDYGQNVDPNASDAFTYFLKNPDAPRIMNTEDMMRDRYNKDKSEQDVNQYDTEEDKTSL